MRAFHSALSQDSHMRSNDADRSRRGISSDSGVSEADPLDKHDTDRHQQVSPTGRWSTPDSGTVNYLSMLLEVAQIPSRAVNNLQKLLMLQRNS